MERSGLRLERVTPVDELVRPVRAAARHGELLEALKSGDPERATHVMQHHIEDMGKPPEGEQ